MCVIFCSLFVDFVDFDSILGQLSSLDDQFNDFGDDEPLSPSKKPQRPAAECKAPVSHSNPTGFKYTEIADDFGDISSQLLDVISELDQLVDNTVVGSESKAIRTPDVKKEVRQRHGVSHGQERVPPPPLHKPLSTDGGKRPTITETVVKNQKPSSTAVRTSVKSDVCSREESASLWSSDSGSSSLSLTQSLASSRLSGRSAAFETLPQVTEISCGFITVQMVPVPGLPSKCTFRGLPFNFLACQGFR